MEDYHDLTLNVGSANQVGSVTIIYSERKGTNHTLTFIVNNETINYTANPDKSAQKYTTKDLNAPNSGIVLYNHISVGNYMFAISSPPRIEQDLDKDGKIAEDPYEIYGVPTPDITFGEGPQIDNDGDELINEDYATHYYFPGNWSTDTLNIAYWKNPPRPPKSPPQNITNSTNMSVVFTFNLESVTTYYWVESGILRELCVCREGYEEGCIDRGKPSNESVYKYVKEPVSSWSKAKNKLLNYCEGFGAITSVILLNETNDYFYFVAYFDGFNNGDFLQMIKVRNITYPGGPLLRLKKQSGAISEKRHIIDLTPYEDILRNKHGAVGSAYTWTLNYSELQRVKQYDWVLYTSIPTQIIGGWYD